MMRLLCILSAAAVVLTSVNAAEARPRKQVRTHQAQPSCFFICQQQQQAVTKKVTKRRVASKKRRVQHVRGPVPPASGQLSKEYAMQYTNDRPKDCYGIPWCGCWLRHQLGVADKAYNLAAHWANYGQRVAQPVIGAVARMYHHVGIVVGVTPKGDPIIKSGNHSKRVATAVYSARKVIEYRM